MTRKYFTSTCKPELKAEYKKLLKLYHPDNGGSVETMQEINAEYDYLSKVLPETAPATEAKQEQPADLSETLKRILEQVRTIPGLIIEVCGSWIWVSGDTYTVKDRLKQMGFKFSSKKKMWYFREESETHRGWKRSADMSTIREKYGSKSVDYKAAAALV